MLIQINMLEMEKKGSPIHEAPANEGFGEGQCT